MYFDKLNRLEICVKGEINVSIHVPEEFEDESDNHLNGVTYREKSPLGRHFDLVYHLTLVSLSQAAAFKFSFTSPAHKVFKSKKRVRVENEEECKEVKEVNRSKRSKFSDTKPTIDKVKTIFASFKSSKNIINVEGSSNLRVTDVEKVADRCSKTLYLSTWPCKY